MNILRNYLSKRPQSLFGLIIFGFAFINLNVMAAEEEHEHEEGEEGIVQISTSLAQELGIETEISSAFIVASANANSVDCCADDSVHQFLSRFGSCETTKVATPCFFIHDG